MGRLTTRRPIRRIRADTETYRPDTLAVEEPMEIRANGTPLYVTMRTPGHDVELAHGFLFTESIAGPEDIAAVRYCAGTDDTGLNTYNVLDVTLRQQVPQARPRNFLATSACGVCGKSSLDDVVTRTRYDLSTASVSVSNTAIATMPQTLRSAQRIFATTGGLHAAGLFTPDGTLLTLREDVGRHNAVDKVIGWALHADMVPLSRTVLIVSGRASFELVQKAVMAGIPVLGAVSAPSSLAADLAHEAGLTLIGFLRADSMNVYTHPHRLVMS